MAFEKRHSISTFVIEFLWILFLVFQESKLVICDGLKDDSLKKALEAIERRQRDLELQENDYFGQPENIGYGFQKTLGFFDSTGPATDLGSFDADRNPDADLQNLLLSYPNDDPDYDTPFEKRNTNFRGRGFLPAPRTRLTDPRIGDDDRPLPGVDYLQLMRYLWDKYRRFRPDDVNIEDLTDEQVQEMLTALLEKGGEEARFAGDYDDSIPYDSLDVIPLRSGKNYRVFDGFGDRRKRHPRVWEGASDKRNSIGDYGPPESDFLYSLKYVNPEVNREAVENLREGGEVLGDEKDRDVLRVLESGRDRQGGEDEPFWGKGEEEVEEEEESGWVPGPVMLQENGYGAFGRNEKRREMVPRVFKNHDGIRVRGKRFPVKRSPVPMRKEVGNSGVSKEVKEIFAAGVETTSPPGKKMTTKKPTEVGKKNATKPEVTKHGEDKKITRRSEKYTKEVFPGTRNSEIADIFSPEKKSKKSIDWSQYFGLDKRSRAERLKKDYLRRAEGHFLAPKRKRYPFERGDGALYEMPFDTRRFNEKRYSYDLGSNIDRVEDRIGDMEEKIIDDAVKYTGAHTGGGTDSLTQVKNKVLQRLEAAYSLEKMKTALEELKNSIQPEKKSGGAGKATTTPPKAETRTTVPKESSSLEKPLPDKSATEVKKRVATKKEGVKESSSGESSDSVEFLNKAYGRGQYESEGCPVLERILRNCLRVEELGGRYSELLVPLCSLQQMCYFCGAEMGFSRTSTCDAVYLSEARNVCQDDGDCLVSARNSMLALQDLYEHDRLTGSGASLSSDSCLANPCIQRYFLSAPGAIYPLQMQK